MCMGTSCRVNGAGKILKQLEENIDTEKYMVEPCGCLHTCGSAPVMAFQGKIYGNITDEQIKEKSVKVDSHN